MKPTMIGVLLLTLAVISGCEQQPPTENAAQPAPTSNQHLSPTLSDIEHDNETADSADEWTDCPEQSPEVCTQVYDPVCGRIDTGIRCVTTPCPSFTSKTFGNACSACSRTEVISFREGRCDDGS